MSGKFIVVEGLEGAGKSTVINTLQQCLRDLGHTIVLTREPGGTPLAEALRDCVKKEWEEQVTTTTELFLMYAARSQLLENKIIPALDSGQWVLADRHDWSSIAYQGGGRQISDEKLNAVRELTLDGFEPDFTILMDIDPAIGLQRAGQRGELDRIEQSGLTFFERTRARYLELAHANAQRCAIIDASQSVEKVQQDVIVALQDYLERI